MQLRHEHEVPVPPDLVAASLFAAHEYDVWNSMARRDGPELRWRVGFKLGGSAEFPAAVETGPAGVLLMLGRASRLRFDHHVDISPGLLHGTKIVVSTTAAGPLRGLARGFDAAETARTFCHDLTERSFWLRQTSDSGYPLRSPGLPPRPGDRNASLEQLHGRLRELEGGMFVAGTKAACVLLDLDERRFMRAPGTADLARLAAFGRWRRFTDLYLEGEDVVIVPEVGAPPLRVRTDPRTLAADAAGAPARGRRVPVDVH
jgi:hypothetical protein